MPTSNSDSYGIKRKGRLTPRQVEGIILHILRDKGEKATWADLLKEVEKISMPEKTLDAGLKRLVISGAIIKDAQMITGKSRSVYIISMPVEPEGLTELRQDGLKKVADELKELRAKLNTITVEYGDQPSEWPPEAMEIYFMVNSSIGRCVGNAVSAVSVLFIEILEHYSKLYDIDTAERYLEVAARSYIPIILLDIAKLTPLGSNFDYPASGIAKTMLIENPGFDETALKILQKSLEKR